MNCTECRKHLPDILLDSGSVPGAQVHIESCLECRTELKSLQSVFQLLDVWQAPEPSPYFDQKLAVRLREEQQRAPEAWWGRLRSRMLFNTGHQFRPAMAGALAVVLIAGVGTAVELSGSRAHGPQTSATVNDLQILDKNEQALQTMDQLLQDDGPGDGASTAQPVS